MCVRAHNVEFVDVHERACASERERSVCIICDVYTLDAHESKRVCMYVSLSSVWKLMLF